MKSTYPGQRLDFPSLLVTFYWFWSNGVFWTLGVTRSQHYKCATFHFVADKWEAYLEPICQDFSKNHWIPWVIKISPGNIGALKSKQVIRNCKFWTDTCFVPNSLEYCIRTETSCRQSKKACVKLSTTGCKWSISYIRLNWPFTLHFEKKPSGNDGNNKYKIKAYIQSNMRQSYKR